MLDSDQAGLTWDHFIR